MKTFYINQHIKILFQKEYKHTCVTYLNIWKFEQKLLHTIYMNEIWSSQIKTNVIIKNKISCNSIHLLPILKCKLLKL